MGELIRNLDAAGVKVPGGFATTATAFREFLAEGWLDGRMEMAHARVMDARRGQPPAPVDQD